MNSVAIVAIVAMFLFAFCLVQKPSATTPAADSGAAEVILYIDPPIVGFPPPLPDRNPHRWP